LIPARLVARAAYVVRLRARSDHSFCIPGNPSSACTTTPSNELASSGLAGIPAEADVAAFCRRKKIKVRAAMIVAQLLDGVSARAIKSVNSLLDEVAGP
jgi:hypothetical protein